MKPNLKSRYATSLEFSTDLALTGELISKIRNISPPDKDGDSLFADSYNGHRAFVWVIEVDKALDKDIRKFRIEFNYEARGGGKLGASMPRIEQLIEILSSISERVDIDCRVAFTFRKRLKAKPIISLPMKYFEFPNMPFDRIQGLHLVKLDGKETKYDVILEAPAQGIVIENIFFKYTSEIDKSLAGKILEQAAAISDNFVSKER